MQFYSYFNSRGGGGDGMWVDKKRTETNTTHRWLQTDPVVNASQKRQPGHLSHATQAHIPGRSLQICWRRCHRENSKNGTPENRMLSLPKKEADKLPTLRRSAEIRPATAPPSSTEQKNARSVESAR